MENIKSQSRRDFIKTTAAVSGGLAVGFHLVVSPRIADAAVQSYMPNAWVRIGTDNSVTIMCARSEMGQSVYTTMPQLVCEEHCGSGYIRSTGKPPHRGSDRNIHRLKCQACRIWWRLP